MNTPSDHDYIDHKVGDVRTAVDDLRQSTAERAAALHARFDSVDAQFRSVDAQFRSVDAKVEATVAMAKAEIIKWIAGLLVAMVALFAGAVGTMVNLLRHPQPAPALSAPAVIIQLTPQGATVSPAVPATGKP